MISVKIASIIAVAAFAAGSFFASPVPAAIAAVIATDVQCTGCVGTSDLAGNAVTAAKIKDGEVKAAEIATGAVGASEIATDAVTASEIAGVTKLLFGQCTLTNAEATSNVAPGGIVVVECSINGVDTDDSALATQHLGSECFVIDRAAARVNLVEVELKNMCEVQTSPLSGKIAIIVFDK